MVTEVAQQLSAQMKVTDAYFGGKVATDKFKDRDAARILMEASNLILLIFLEPDYRLQVTGYRLHQANWFAATHGKFSMITQSALKCEDYSVNK